MNGGVTGKDDVDISPARTLRVPGDVKVSPAWPNQGDPWSVPVWTFNDKHPGLGQGMGVPKQAQTPT